MNKQSLTELQEVKEKLVKKAADLRKNLMLQEINGYKGDSFFNLSLNSNEKNRYETRNKFSERYENKLCEISYQVSGIAFEHVDKKWLYGDVYSYVVHVVTQSVSFYLELTVLSQDYNNFEIIDITCQFVKADDCYTLEIIPWVQDITKTRNFSFLVSVSNYNEQSVTRSKILHNLETQKYVTSEECKKENGGFLVYVTPSYNTKIYLQFQWSLKFLEHTLRIEHFFFINPMGNLGMEFAQKHCALLKGFCKIGLKRDTLQRLWDDLCRAIDNFQMDI